MAEYYVLEQASDPKYCVIDHMPADIPHNYYAVDGISLGRSAYEYVFDMSADEPGIAIADSIENAFGYTLVSARLKAFLELHAKARIEFTPFKLRNHRRRIVPDELYIANVIGMHDCVDRSATTGREDPVNPGRYMVITKLALDPARIDTKVNLFRLAIRPKYLIVREDLKNALDASGMTGLAFVRVGDKAKLW